MRVPEEPVFVHLFRQKPVFTSLHLKSPVHVHRLCTQVLTILTEQKLKQEWQNSPAGTRQTDSINLVWFGEIERKLAKLSKTTFAYRSSS
jgi:hypothetical protein